MVISRCRFTKSGFWTQSNFYDVDLTPLREEAMAFYFSQPVVGPLPPHTIIAPPVAKAFDFRSMSIAELQRFEIHLHFQLTATTQVHGIALWFDCTFPGSKREILLSTSPTDPLTHWYQVRCMLRAPLAVGSAHALTGSLRFEANESRGYNVHMTVTNANTGVSQTNVVVTQCALHHFQYATPAQPAANWNWSPPAAAGLGAAAMGAAGDTAGSTGADVPMASAADGCGSEV